MFQWASTMYLCVCMTICTRLHSWPDRLLMNYTNLWVKFKEELHNWVWPQISQNWKRYLNIYFIQNSDFSSLWHNYSTFKIRYIVHDIFGHGWLHSNQFCIKTCQNCFCPSWHMFVLHDGLCGDAFTTKQSQLKTWTPSLTHYERPMYHMKEKLIICYHPLISFYALSLIQFLNRFRIESWFAFYLNSL